MAPESSNQKRKRGAPAAVARSDASRRDTRRRKTDEQSEATVYDPLAEQATFAGNKENENSGKGGRPKKGESKKANAEADGVRRSKRDRRSADDNPWWISAPNGPDEQQGKGGDISLPPKKRARTSQDVARTGPKAQGVRSRTAAEQTSPAQTKAGKTPRRSKAPTASPAVATAQPDPDPKRRGRPRKSDNPTAGDGEQPVEDTPEPSKWDRPRLSSVSINGQTPTRDVGKKSSATKAQPPKITATGGNRASIASQRRVSNNPSSQDTNASVAEMDDELEASLPQVPKYRHIEQRTRQVPQSIIKAKWAPLDGASIDAITSILSDASRPVLLRLRDRELRHQQGQNILRIFAGRLQSKLRKGMPFPPPTAKVAGSKGDKIDSGGGHVEELNFETTVASIESMQTMLDPILHSVALLEKEKAKEEAALEKEYETLRTLESNARAEARTWRERLKKSHPLAPEPLKQHGLPELDRDAGEVLALSKQRRPPLTPLFHDAKDEGLLSMSQQIASHMESIHKNVQPIRDVLPAIGKSRAALQGALQTHLAPQQLEKVILG